MDHDVQRLLRFLADTTDTQHTTSNPSWFGENPDAEVLDTFSRAVTGVVARTGPSVVALTGDDASPVGDQLEAPGSGVVISPDGFALASHSVVGPRRRLDVLTHDGIRLHASVIGVDPLTDLALLKLKTRGMLHAVLTRQPVKVGQQAIAMGNSLGLQVTASAGTVHAVGCAAPGCFGGVMDDLIQHTAALQPTDLGGPIVDARGHVVGVNVAIQQGGRFGLAVPSEIAAWVVQELLQHGVVRRMPLGASFGSVCWSRQAVRELDLVSPAGVQVTRVDPNGLARHIGLCRGDVIATICGRLVSGVGDIHRLLARIEHGVEVTVTVVRAGKLFDLTFIA